MTTEGQYDSAKLQEAIKSYLDSPTQNAALLQPITTELHNRTLKLLQLVQQLGESLTAKNEVARARATTLLGVVLQLMISGNNEVVSMDITQPTPRNSWLTPGEICYLVQFFTSRLADFGTQVEVLFCLHVLLYNYCRTKHGTTPAPIDARNVNAIILSLSEEVHTQSLSVNARRWVFEILKLLLEDYSSALADQDQDGSAYVYCFIQAMDGEKDPRNLVLCFDLVTDICRTLPTRVYIRFSEELFEVTSCYFPITFQERKDDPHAVKRTDLVTKLNSALGACPGLASHVVPFLLDKLTASLVQTKLDTLVCLRHVIRAYLERGWGREIDVHNANEGRIIQSVWSGVRQELMTSTDQPVIDECLVSLRDIVLSLSLHDTNDMQHYFKYALLNPQQQHAFDWPHASYLHFMLNALTKDCHQQLKSFDSKVSLLSAQVLHTAASAHFKSSTIILHHSIPWLMSLYTTETDLDNKLAIVNIIADFIRFTSDVQLDSTTSIQGLKGPHPLRVFKDELFALLSSLSQSTESRQHSVALQALTHLAVITDQPDTSHTAQPLLLEQQTSLVITYLTAALTHHDTTLRQLARKSLVQLASYSWLIAPLQQLCIQSLVHSLNELTLASFKTQHVAKDVSLIAEALTDLSVTNSVLYHAILNKLLAMMYNVLQTTLSSTEAHCGVEIVEQLLDAILSCFNNLLPIHRTAMKSAGLSSEWQLTESWSINVHHALLVLALHTAGQSGVSIALHESITRHLLAISTTLVSMLHDQLQVHDTFVDQVLFQFYLQRNIPFLHELLNNVDELNKQLPDLAALLQTHPITLGAVTVTPFLVELIAAVTCVVNKQLTEQHLTLCTQLLTALFDQTLAALSPRTRQLLAIAVASLFDKIPLSASAAMDQFLTARLPQLLSTVQDASVALVTRESAVMLLIYLCAACTRRQLAREDKSQSAWWMECWQHVIGLLRNPDLTLAHFAAMNFSALLQHDHVTVIQLIEQSAHQSELKSSLLSREITLNEIMPNKKQLYRQKTFTYEVPMLMKEMTSSQQSSASHYNIVLLAWSQLMSQLPVDVLLNDLSAILPVLFNTLHSMATQLTAGTMTADLSSVSHSIVSLICLLNIEVPCIMEEHVEQMVPHLLSLAVHHPEMKMRVIALDCLTECSKFAYIKIASFKGPVLHALNKALDDKKRLVRRHAVKCRNEWFVLAQAGQTPAKK